MKSNAQIVVTIAMASHIFAYHQWMNMIRKTLCFIGIHQYEDHIKLKALTDKGMPFSAKEVCKGCGKIRNEVAGFIEAKGETENDRIREDRSNRI